MQINFAMPTEMPPKYCVVFVKLKLRMKCVVFAFCPLYKELCLKYTHRYLQTEHSFPLLMQYYEKTSSQNLALFVFYACKKTAIFTCYRNRLVVVW